MNHYLSHNEDEIFSVPVPPKNFQQWPEQLQKDKKGASVTPTGI